VTVTVILLTSLVFWMISCLIAVAQEIFMTEVLYTSPGSTRINFMVTQLQYSLSQCIVISVFIVLHHLKMRVMKNSQSTPGFLRSRMNRVITIVLARFSVCGVAAMVTVFLVLGQFFSPTHRTLLLVSNLSFYINFASNPYIYFMSFVVMNYLTKCTRSQ
jgi:hypothetical protein